MVHIQIRFSARASAIPSSRIRRITGRRAAVFACRRRRPVVGFPLFLEGWFDGGGAGLSYSNGTACLFETSRPISAPRAPALMPSPGAFPAATRFWITSRVAPMAAISRGHVNGCACSARCCLLKISVASSTCGCSPARIHTCMQGSSQRCGQPQHPQYHSAASES